MIPLLNWLPADGWPRFAADSIWQSTLVGLAAVVCIHWIARRPATRACISLAALLAAVALPVVSAVARRAEWGLLAAPVLGEPASGEAIAAVDRRQVFDAAAEPAAAYGVILSPRTDETGATAVNTAPAKRASTSPPPTTDTIDGNPVRPNATALGLVAWGCVSGVMLMRLLAGAGKSLRLLREASPCNDLEANAAIRVAAERLKVAAPRLLVSGAVSSPTVFAFGRGAVLVPNLEGGPAAASDERSNSCQSGAGVRDRWLAIFCHELGHVRRRDGWNRLAAEMALVVLPWQPLVWLLRRDLLRYAEEACDDWAVASGADPIEFATILTEFVPSVPRLILGATIMTTDAKTRILRLLALRESPRPRTTWLQLMTIAVAACALVVGVACAQQANDDRGESAVKATPKPWAKPKDAAKRDLKKPAAKFVYVLEPPDVVEIDPIQLMPKGPLRIERHDQLQIDVTGVQPNAPINGIYQVDADGEVSLGPEYGRVLIAGLTVKEAIQQIDEHLSKTLKAPKVALTVAEKAEKQHISGTHSIAPDGYVNLGEFGQVYITGMTISESREAIEKKLAEHFDEPSIALKVTAQNSKVYYVIIEGGAQGDHITRFPWTGNETVLDALAQVNAVIRKDMSIYIARPGADDAFQTIAIDWAKLKSGELSARKYQLLPGDRVFLQQANLMRGD